MAVNPDTASGQAAADQAAASAGTPNPYASYFANASNNLIGGNAYKGIIADPFTIMFSNYAEGRFSRYVEGSQYDPFDWEASRVADLQARLKASGLLKDYQPGVWSPEDAIAYAKALGWANTNGVAVDDALAGLIQSADVRTGSGSGLGPAPLTDDDVRAIANKTAQNVIGRALREDEMANFMPAFRGAYGAGTSPAVAADTAVRNQAAPVEAGGYGMGQVMGAIDQMLKGGGVQ